MDFAVSIQFQGNCKEAVIYYANIFNQQAPTFVTYGEVDTSFDENVQIAADEKDNIMSACLQIAGTNITFSDMPKQFTLVQGNNINMSITLDSAEEAEEIYNRFCGKAQIFVPFAQISDRGYYAYLADPYGISWMIQAS